MADTKTKRIQIMEYYAERGRNLREILHLIGLKWETALRYCRKYNIYFPDHKRRQREDVDG